MTPCDRNTRRTFSRGGEDATESPDVASLQRLFLAVWRLASSALGEDAQRAVLELEQEGYGDDN